MKVAINGLGRIGKTFLRAAFENEKTSEKIEIPCINVGPAHIEHVAHLLRHDSVMGPFPGNVVQEGKILEINGRSIVLLQETDPEKLPWDKYSVSWVVESTGLFRTRQLAQKHLEAGALKVLVSAPSPDCDITIIPGVNDQLYNKENHKIVSLGSCTTNCFAPIVRVLQENVGLECGQMTTVHAYTNDQVLVDGVHKDLRRARAAAINIIPTTTGADKVITTLFPELDGKITGTSIRVPVPKVSLIDFSFVTKTELSPIKINELFETASKTYLKGILEYSSSPLVSSDFAQNPASAIFDSLLTKTAGNMSKLIAWYDNEYGYCVRMREFLLHSQVDMN